MSLLFAFLRFMIRVPAPKINPKQAIEIAVAETVKRGQPPPIYNGVLRPIATEHLREWCVWLDDCKPSRTVMIDNQTGEVKEFCLPLD